MQQRQKFKLLSFTLKAIILWLLVFSAGRVLFILLNNDGTNVIRVVPAFYKGILLDVSAACYLILLPVLIFLWNVFNPSVVKEKIMRWYFIIAISIVVMVETTSIFLFREWGNTLNYRAIRYLLYPSEASASIEWKTIIMAVIISAITISAWNFLFRKTIVLHPNVPEKKWTSVFALIILPLLFMGMRGGFRQISLSESNAYFSENNFLNQAALNKTWYFLRNVLNNVQQKKTFYHFPQFEQAGLIEKLYPEGGHTNWLHHSKPNVVVVILEGWNVDIIESMGGIKGVTPCFDTLAKSGLLFTNMYASGTRTDQGVVSLLSGFPALPDLSIVQDIDKSVKLPSLIKDLKNAGYFTSFIYGGEPEFCNFKTYFVAQGTDKLIDKHSFRKSEQTITWGVPDHILFERASEELHNQREPFLSVILTQSSHQPYDSPFRSSSQNPDNAEKYKASARYMDKAISVFMKKCSNQKWYKNTLFVFVSDHGNMLPLHRDYNDHERFHIPMLLYGNVLDTVLIGNQDSTIANHHDLPAILLSQLGIPHQGYHFSKDVSSPSVVPFAYWSTDNTMGWITENQKIGVNLHNAEVFSWTKKPVAEEQKTGLGYMQEVLKEYEKY